MLALNAYNGSAAYFEETDDLELEPLREIVIGHALSNDDSLPLSATHTVTKKNLYYEIQEGLHILLISKKNLACYKTYVESSQGINNLCSFTNCLWMLGIPSVIFTGALCVHSYLTEELKGKISALQPLLLQAQKANTTFMSTYSAQINKLTTQKAISDNSGYTCLARALGDRSFDDFITQCCACQSPTTLSKWVEAPPYNNETEHTYTAMAYAWMRLNHIGNCNKPFQKIYKDVTDCLNQRRSESWGLQQSIEAFIAQYASEKAAYEQSVNHLQAEIEACRGEGTWNLFLTFCLTTACMLSVGYVIYLYYQKKRSYEDYVHGSHQLEECLAPKQIEKIVELAQRLELPINNLSVNELVEKLKDQKPAAQIKETSFALFTLFKQNNFPVELFQIILQIAIEPCASK